MTVLTDIADRLCADLKITTVSRRRKIEAALLDAYDAGKLHDAPASSPRAGAMARTALGERMRPGAGLMVQIAHTIKAEDFAEHGEVALLAWVQQSMRELAANGASPERDSTYQFVQLGDGTITISAEGAILA